MTTCSVESIASLPPQERERIVRSLSPTDASRLLYEWRFWARPAQLAPEGDWRTWLILAGRGFGKTRAAGEWLRQRIDAGSRHVIVAGATASDVRDIMVDGESGILAISPPWNRPKYEPSKARLTWPSGARALLMSAEEPDRFRGKQCLHGDTVVLMADGSSRRIRDVRVGDVVRTRRGPRAVTWSGLVRQKARVYLLRDYAGRTIIATGDHPIWVSGRGFVPLVSLRNGDILCVTRASGGVERRGTDTATGTTQRSFGCIGKFGKRHTAPFQKASTFTTSTVISRTTGSRISSCCPVQRTTASITTKSCGPSWPLRTRIRSRHAGDCVRSGCDGLSFAHNAATRTKAARQSRDDSAPSHALRGQTAWCSSQATPYAHTAAPRSWQRDGHKGTARANATPRRARREIGSSGICLARGVSGRSVAPAATRGFVAARAHALSTTRLESVQLLDEPADVYDITVAGSHEFFANGILVHNCDTFVADELASWPYPEAWDQLQLGFRLGAAYGVEPRGVVSTTPRPTPIIRALAKDDRTAVTRGSTFDNAANLAPAFIDQIVKRYEGTRLGRQELYAEILDDVEGALWSRDLVEKTRIREAPELLRTVVAIDPAVTANESSDETGIVVVGLGADLHMYVLADFSGRMTPNEWGVRAVKAYNEFRADRIVAEENNGGKLVEANLRTIVRSVPYKGVRASQGKRARAEPIAALYEQGRVHHVGMFAKLEDQMCTWQPLTGERSPDRMDALVWGLSELAFSASKRPEGFDVLRWGFGG